MVGLNEKSKQAASTSKSKEQLQQYHLENEQRRYRVTAEHSNGEAVRYKSTNDPEIFLKYLESRIPKWEHLSQQTGNGRHHAERMLNKTNEIITSLAQ